MALGDDIRDAPGAVAALVGERRDLSAADSLGIYPSIYPSIFLAGRPRRRPTDAERNCISDRRPEGVGAAAADKLLWLVGTMRRRPLIGIRLKDEQIVMLWDGGQ